jgi:hypothetical protein
MLLYYNYKKNQLNSLLKSYNLCSTVNFPIRITNTSKSATDNIFIDYSIIGKFELFPMYNGTSIMMHNLN